jgi:hypothetical protein
MTTFTPTRTTQSIINRHGHQCAQGFCTVCGSTWPCWRAQADDSHVVASRMSTLSLGLPRC